MTLLMGYSNFSSPKIFAKISFFGGFPFIMELPTKMPRKIRGILAVFFEFI
jgi:hypothetical protein